MAIRAAAHCPSHLARSQSVSHRNLPSRQGYARSSRSARFSHAEHHSSPAQYSMNIQPPISDAKPLKNRVSMEWNEELKNRAKELVFGERKRKDFTAEERNLADRYQDKILEIDGGLILRNTYAELEQEAVSNALKQLQAPKKKLEF